jgi:hypothetical protein
MGAQIRPMSHVTEAALLGAEAEICALISRISAGADSKIGDQYAPTIRAILHPLVQTILNEVDDRIDATCTELIATHVGSHHKD